MLNKNWKRRLTYNRYWYLVESMLVSLAFGAAGIGLFSVATQINKVMLDFPSPTVGYYMTFIVMWAVLIASVGSLFVAAVILSWFAYHLFFEFIRRCTR